MRMDWLEQENLNSVTRTVKHQKLEKFMNLTENLYPNLVRVFFTNLSFEDDVMYSHTKGVDMVITPAVKNTSRIMVKGNTNSLEDFNKNEFFRSYLRNTYATMRGYHVGGLSMNPRILAFIMV